MKISYRVKWQEETGEYSKKDLPHAIYRHINAGWNETLIAAFSNRKIAEEFADFMNQKEVGSE